MVIPEIAIRRICAHALKVLAPGRIAGRAPHRFAPSHETLANVTAQAIVSRGPHVALAIGVMHHFEVADCQGVSRGVSEPLFCHLFVSTVLA